jgi:UDP-GlcNAc:undecaprenyl-phosphate GlcNAc-1-phosphate transferase
LIVTLPVVLLVVFVSSAIASLAVAERLTHINVKGRHPERSRHWSASGIPRLGGIAVFASAPIAIIIASVARARVSGVPQLPELAGSLILGSAILFVVGLLDDLRGVRPFAKLLAQTAAALIVCRTGFSIEHVSFLSGYGVDLGFLAMPVTVLWLVGVSNAFNLIDGMDGLAGGVAIIALIAIAVTALILGNLSVPVYTVALIGALLGFLRYNWPSARLFMGDSGSLVVGFLLAVLAVKASSDRNHVTHALIPVFALAYPLLDTGVAILRRWLRGVPLSRADRRHVHHQLSALGMETTKSLSIIYLTSAALAALGLLGTFAPPAITMLATMAGLGGLVLVMGLGIYWLEYHEFFEVGASVASAPRKARRILQDRINARDVAQLIRRAGSLDDVQTILHDNAGIFRFAYMKLSDPESRMKMPGRITQELQALRLWKLEYPILHDTPPAEDGLCLTIWSAMENLNRPAGAERVAEILGPAIAEWVRHRGHVAATASYAERFIHQTDTETGLDLTPEDQRALARVRWQPAKESTLEA